jgi:two-component system, NarL family, nitrate/nitrite response regulator NarL
MAAQAPAARYRVVLLSDVRLYREGLVHALASTSQLEVVGAAPVDDGSLTLLEAARPDIVLLEAIAARSPAIVQAILAVAPKGKVIAFAVGDEEQDAILCAEAGAAGYVSREASIDDLVSTIVRVAQGEFPCSPRVAALLARRISLLAAHRDPDNIMAALTSREREILRLIDDGLSNKEIAQRLGIGVSTVKNHVHNILDKTSASRRAQAAARVRTPAWILRSIPVAGKI